MSWDKIKEVIGNSAPLIGGLVGGPAGAGIGAIISSALGTDNNPDAIYKELTSNPDAILKLRELEFTHKMELEKLYINADTQRLKTVNDTMRSEYQSEDKYVKRWRPTFGYAMVFTWSITWLALCYVIIWDTDKAAAVITALTGTAMMWSIALAVLGVNVHQRSKDKQTMAGFQPKTILEQLRGK